MFVQVRAQVKNTTIEGAIIDMSSKPLAFASVSLLNATDSTLVKIAVTDDTGGYVFTGIPYGRFFISASAVNVIVPSSAVYELSTTHSTIHVAALKAEMSAATLAGVTVVSKKPLVEQKFDRMVVNVDASVTNIGATALEVLEKSPGVVIDKDGTIGLKGKQGVLVMIDGKPSYLGDADLANLLSSLNATQLCQIEIMTNPSAKYDASGNAGVITVKTKKNTIQGLNGSISEKMEGRLMVVQIDG